MKNKNGGNFYENNKGLVWLLIIIVCFILIVNYFKKKDDGGNEVVPTNIEIAIKPDTEVEIRMGYSTNLIAMVNGIPESKVKWASENETIAKVDNGTVTAVNYGKTKIYATYYDDNNKEYKASKEVTIADGNSNILLQGVSFKDGDLFMPVGETYTLNLVLQPANAHIESIEYKVGNEQIVKVDKNGIVGSISEGDTRIIAVVNKNLEAVLDVHVDNEYKETEIVVCPTSINFDTDSLKVKLGTSKNLKYNVSPNNVDHTKLTWTSSDESIVTVDKNGRITANSVGTAIISVSSLNGKRDDITVEVESEIVNVNKIVLSSTAVNMKVGESLEIFPTILPEKASNKGLSYQSTNPSVASPYSLKDGEGVLISALKSGTATIIMRSSNNIENRLIVNVTGDSSDNKDSIDEDGTKKYPTIKVTSNKNNIAKSYAEVLKIPASGKATISFSLSSGIGKIRYCINVYGSSPCTPYIELSSNGSFEIPSGGIYQIRVKKYDYNNNEIASNSDNYINGVLNYYVNTTSNGNNQVNTIGYSITNAESSEVMANNQPKNINTSVNITVTDASRYLKMCYTTGVNCTPNIDIVSVYNIYLNNVGTYKIFIQEYDKNSNQSISSLGLWFVKVVNNNPPAPTMKTAVIPDDSYCKSKADRMYTGSTITLTKNPGEGYHFVNNTGIAISTYFVRAVLDNGYIWQDNTTSYKVISCKIEGTSITPPNAINNCDTNVKYTGSAVTLTKNVGSGYTLSGNIQTQPGNHKITAKLNAGYIWSDGTISDKEFYCTLSQDTTVTAVKDIIIDGKITEAQETLGQRLAMLRIDTNRSANRLYYCLGDCTFNTSVFKTATQLDPSFDIVFTVYGFNPASQVRGVWYYNEYFNSNTKYANFRRIKSNDEEVLNLFMAQTENGEVTHYSDVKDLDLSY